MNRELIIEPEAEFEIVEAASRYEARNPGLSAEFLRAVEGALAAIQRNPHQYQIVFRQVRRVVLRRFPYALMYLATEKETIVVACVHSRRHPKGWQTRMR
jgi:plasmid stabilization system protein ParE